ncbi:hypothetical protein COO60DRAFT_1698491 [Scenedesmus sp. NREL 46B-D3]|nr:hypothetical protein COO60DRAFT_1698491 [Scenedesmus sp. NREL 46B-D3]
MLAVKHRSAVVLHCVLYYMSCCVSFQCQSRLPQQRFLQLHDPWQQLACPSGAPERLRRQSGMYAVARSQQWALPGVELWIFSSSNDVWAATR